MIFQDRADAGRKLAQALEPYAREDCLILAIPRGGIILGYEVASALHKPLDVMVVRKLGAPGQEELAIGAVGPGNVLVLNQELVDTLGVREATLQSEIERQTQELNRRIVRYRGKRPFPSLIRKTVILVDDGLATGATARASIAATKALKAGKIVLAVPVGAESTVKELRREVDEMVCLETPEFFESVSLWYRNFPQNSDDEVTRLLESAWANVLRTSEVKPINPAR